MFSCGLKAKKHKNVFVVPDIRLHVDQVLVCLYHLGQCSDGPTPVKLNVKNHKSHLVRP